MDRWWEDSSPRASYAIVTILSDWPLPVRRFVNCHIILFMCDFRLEFRLADMRMSLVVCIESFLRPRLKHAPPYRPNLWPGLLMYSSLTTSYFGGNPSYTHHRNRTFSSNKINIVSFVHSAWNRRHFSLYGDSILCIDDTGPRTQIKTKSLIPVELTVQVKNRDCTTRRSTITNKLAFGNFILWLIQLHTGDRMHSFVNNVAMSR